MSKELDGGRPMPDSFSRPKVTPCPVRFRLADGSSVDGNVWLLPDPDRPSGVMLVEDLLAGDRDFIAVGLAGGGSILVNRDAIRIVETAEDGPGSPEIDVSASFDVVTLRLDSGEEVSGILRAVSRADAGRMSDVFNAAGRFITVSIGDRRLLVARDRITRVTF
jgi:hypothetical protein